LRYSSKNIRLPVKLAVAPVKLAAALFLIFITSAPMIYLALVSVLKAFSGEPFAAGNISFSMFAGSILLNLAAAAVSVLMGLLSAVCIWTFFEKYSLKLLVILLTLVLIPTFIHTQAWIFFLDKLNKVIGYLIGIVPDFTGYFAVILTTSFAYLPLTSGLCLLALLSVPQDISDLLLLDGAQESGFIKIYMPFAYPMMLSGGSFVFLININDYSIPSIFGVNVFALKLFSLFSAGVSVYSIFFSAFPLIILTFISIMALRKYISGIGLDISSLHAENPFKNEKFIIIPAVTGFIILMLFVFVPLLNIVMEALKASNGVEILENSSDEFLYSFAIALAAAFFSVIPALIFCFAFNNSSLRILMIILISLPFIMPASIAGLSLIEFWNRPVLNLIYTSAAMPAVAMICKFSFIEVLIISFAICRVDKDITDMMKLFYPGFITYCLCMFRLIWKDVTASLLIVFALVLGEYGIVLLVTPPGYQMLSIKIYNYLHYGDSETAAMLCLSVLVSVFITAAILFVIAAGEKPEKG
jgi:iron(III) transport system permease protein